MEVGRSGYTNQKQIKRNKGVALVTVLALSIVVLLALGGIYWIITNLLSSSQTIKTYTSIKEAAKGGVEEAIIRINSNDIISNDCTSNCTGNDNCCVMDNCVIRKMKYRVNNQEVEGKVHICSIGLVSGFQLSGTPAGYQLSGTSESEDPDSVAQAYRIISEVQDRQYNTQYRIELVYLK